MSDAPAPAAAPQQSAPSEPSQQGGESNEFTPSPGTQQALAGEQETAPKPGQTRGPDGKWVGKPGEAEPPKPKSGRERLLEMVDEEGNVTLKLHGKPTRMSFERALAELEVGHAGKQSFTEADKARKEAQALIQSLKSDPRAALKAAGLDPIEWAKKAAWEAIQREEQEAALSPEQRAFRQQQEEFQQKQQAFQQQQEALESQELEHHNQTNARILNEHVPQALKAVGLPSAHPKVIEAFTANLRPLVEHYGAITPQTIAMAAQATKDEAWEMADPVLEASPEEFITRFGERGTKFLNALRRYDMAQLDKQRGGGAQPVQPVQQQREETGPAYFDEKEWKRQQRLKGFI